MKSLIMSFVGLQLDFQSSENCSYFATLINHKVYIRDILIKSLNLQKKPRP